MMQQKSKLFLFSSMSALLIAALIACTDGSSGLEENTGVNPDPSISSTTSSSASNHSNPSSGQVFSSISPLSSNSEMVSSSSSATTTLPVVDISDKLANITKTCPAEIPSLSGSAKKGWGSRYWDCCKPSCAWPNKFGYDASKTVRTCNIDNVEISTQVATGDQYSPYEGVKSSCEGGPAFTCYDQAPFAVCDSLAYGYVAASASALGDAACGSCFLLQFDGGMHEYAPKHEHAALKGKKMIVMVTNIGHDVVEGQFDLMIPGGGMGAFTGGCSAQWGVNNSDESVVGKNGGGFRSYCEEKLGYYPEPSLESNQECVRKMCDNLFKKPGLEDMLQGCYWYVDWYMVANNPTYSYEPIECPKELVDGFPTTFPVVDMSRY